MRRDNHTIGVVVDTVTAGNRNANTLISGHKTVILSVYISKQCGVLIQEIIDRNIPSPQTQTPSVTVTVKQWLSMFL